MGLAPRYLRAFAKQRLDDEIVFEDADKLATNRFRPYGVVCPRPISCSFISQHLPAGRVQCAGIVPFK